VGEQAVLETVPLFDNNSVGNSRPQPQICPLQKEALEVARSSEFVQSSRLEERLGFGVYHRAAPEPGSLESLALKTASVGSVSQRDFFIDNLLNSLFQVALHLPSSVLQFDINTNSEGGQTWRPCW